MFSAIPLLMFDTTELLLVRIFLSRRFLIKLSAYSAACSAGSPSRTNLKRLTHDKNWNTLSCLILINTSFDSSK